MGGVCVHECTCVCTESQSSVSWLLSGSPFSTHANPAVEERGSFPLLATAHKAPEEKLYSDAVCKSLIKCCSSA